jgi:hypothetical protein
MRILVLGVLLFGVAGCSLPPPSLAQRQAAARDQRTGGEPNASGPRGVLATSAPGDDVASPLRCRPDGQDTYCTRGR